MAIYRVNKNISQNDLVYYTGKNGPLCLDLNLMTAAIEIANKEIIKEYEFNKKRLVSLISNIPKKNMSGAFGECYGKCLAILMDGLIAKNMHESSGPDMLPVIPETEMWTKGQEKSYCPFDGFDMKGCVTEEMHFMKVKPSSHHDQTTGVLTVQWRSKSGTFGEIVGIYYTRYLSKEDWKITRVPKNENSKLTSNARLLGSGLEKVRKGWIVVREDISPPRDENLVRLYGLDNYTEIDSQELMRKFKGKSELFDC
jgi:hypothetical protein